MAMGNCIYAVLQQAVTDGRDEVVAVLDWYMAVSNHYRDYFEMD